jgi:5-methyltetrahydrofolate--homocysteine methyltransferase
MSRFREALRSGRVLLMDGAMGTELLRTGLPPGECLDMCNVTRPESVLAIHRAYAAAGAECLLTNTFQANPFALARHQLADRLEEVQRAGVELARAAAGPERFVLGDVGPLSPPHPLLSLTDRCDLRHLLQGLVGVDGILLETWSDPDCVGLPLLLRRALPELEDVPILLSLTYRSDHAAGGHVCPYCTFNGTEPGTCKPPEWYAEQAEKNGVAALGVNCGRDIAMSDITDILRRYRGSTGLPLFARPNAGTPRREGGHWLYPLTPAQMAAGLPGLLVAGATLVGGCCGTTQDHIAALRPLLTPRA